MSHETQLIIGMIFVVTAVIVAVILYFIFKYEARKNQEHQERAKEIMKV